MLSVSLIQKVSLFQVGGLGSSVIIDGRAARATLDPDVQNWESGIDLTVQGCTFFHNFATFCCSLYILDAWPLVSVIESTDFVHNEAMAIPSDSIHWITESTTGPVPKVGIASHTATDCYWDGGHSEGMFVYIVAGSFVRVDGNGKDEPDALWDWNFEGCDWVDHGGLYSVHTLCHEIYPVMTDKQLRLDYSLVDSSVTGSVNIAPGDFFDGEPIRHGEGLFANLKLSRVGEDCGES